MRIYIAASSHPLEIARAKSVRERLIARGHVITSTWIENVEAVGAANPRNASKRERSVWMRRCLDEVCASDALLFLVPPLDRPTRGAWMELDRAIAKCREVVCSGDTLQSIGCALGLETDSDDEAVTLFGFGT